MPKYGRYVQDLVDYCMGIEDRGERTRCAKAIVKMMEKLFPNDGTGKGTEKVYWDHLARMADYGLDVDYPVEVASEEDMSKRPEPLKYPASGMRARHYGRRVEELIKAVAAMPESAERDVLVELTAMQMSKDLYYWNKDVLNAEKIAGDLERYSGGKIRIDPAKLNTSGLAATMGEDKRNQSARRRSQRR